MFQSWINRWTFLVVVVIAFVDGFLVASQFQRGENVTSPTQASMLEDVFEQKNSSEIKTIEESKKVPFTSQSPYGFWYEPWNDFAEEACSYMVSKWAKGDENGTRSGIANELLAIGEWEQKELGTMGNTDLIQTLRILKEFYGIDAELSYDVTEASLSLYLDQGNVIIIPVNGQLLENPYYGKPGPEFHMLIIYGQDGDMFITNDPGTVRGESYPYSKQKILESVQDLNGERRIIVVKPGF